MKSSIYVSASLAALVLGSQVARAQEVEEIVVTAQKRSENLQNVPITVAAITGRGLTSAGVTRTEDLAVAVPGFSLTKQGGATQLYIRGVGSTGGNAGQESAVATFVDGVYMPAQTGATFAFNFVDRVEVLKGPQGTLYGRNATGGALNIITRTPQFDFGLDAEMGYGNKETMQGSLYATGPLTSNIAADFAVTYNDQNKGFGVNLASGREIHRNRDIAVRSKLLFNLSEATTVTLSGDYGKSSGSSATAYRSYSPTSRQFITGLTGWPFGFWDISSDVEPRTSTSVSGVSGKLEQDIGTLKLTSITAYRKSKTNQNADIDESAAPIFGGIIYERDKQFTQEVQLASDGSGSLKWIAGLFFLDGSAANRPFSINGTLFEGDPVFPFRSLTVLSRQKTTSYAAFGQATYAITPETNLTLGARYTIDKRSVDATGSIELLSGVLVPAFAPFERSKTFKKPTWRISLDHKLTEDVLVYASYNRGFQSGIYNTVGLSVLQPVVNPEQLDAYEVGLKSTLLDRRLRFNVSGFYYDYKNLQLSKIVGGSQVLVNAAKARMYGIDVDFTATPTDFLTLSGGGSYVHDRYRDFPGAPFATTNNAFPYGNITGTLPNAKGNRLNRTPDFTFTATADVHFPLGEGELSTSATYAYNDGFYWEPDNFLRQKAFGLLSGQIKWTAPSEKWYIRAYGRNLTNKKYFSMGNTSALGDIGVAAPGRLYGAAIGVNF